MFDFFVQGGGFMWPILIALLFGLAVVGERAYSLVNSSSDTNKFFEDVKNTKAKDCPSPTEKRPTFSQNVLIDI